MTYFNRKLMKRDIPASATVEGALVIPVILYAVAAVMFLLQLISIRMHVNDALYNALRKFNTYSYTSQVMTGEIYKSTFFAIFVDEIGSDYAKKHYIAGGNTGWNFYGSDIADDNSTVKISLKYTVKNPFNILGKRQITIYEKRITDIWLGEEKDGFESNNNDESEYVYITQYGEVYHLKSFSSYVIFCPSRYAFIFSFCSSVIWFFFFSFFWCFTLAVSFSVSFADESDFVVWSSKAGIIAC